MKVAHLPEPAEERVVFRDGLGVRERRDTGTGELVEWFHLDPVFAGVEIPLRERVTRLAKLQHVKFARILGLEPARKDRGPVLVSSHVPGSRLSDVLEMAGHGLVTFEPGAGLQILRDVLGALAVLHDSRNVAHGCLGPERVVLTPTGRVVMVEHVLGHALDRLQRPRHQLWREWRVPTPPAAGTARFDMQTDCAQAGLLGLAVLLGRPIDEEEYPHRLRGLLPLVQDRLSQSPSAPIASDVVVLLERLAPVDSRRAFKTLRDAQHALEGLFSGGGAAFGASPARIKGVVAAVAAIAAAEAPAAAAIDAVESRGTIVVAPVSSVLSPAETMQTTPPKMASTSEPEIDIDALLALEAELEGGSLPLSRPPMTQPVAASAPSMSNSAPVVAPIAPAAPATADDSRLEVLAQERLDLERQFAELVASVAPATDLEAVHLIPETPATSEPLVDARVLWSSMPAEDPADASEPIEPAGVSLLQEIAAASALEAAGASQDDEPVPFADTSVFSRLGLPTPIEPISIVATDGSRPTEAIDQVSADWWREALPWRDEGVTVAEPPETVAEDPLPAESAAEARVSDEADAQVAVFRNFANEWLPAVEVAESSFEASTELAATDDEPATVEQTLENVIAVVEPEPAIHVFGYDLTSPAVVVAEAEVSDDVEPAHDVLTVEDACARAVVDAPEFIALAEVETAAADEPVETASSVDVAIVPEAVERVEDEPAVDLTVVAAEADVAAAVEAVDTVPEDVVVEDEPATDIGDRCEASDVAGEAMLDVMNVGEGAASLPSDATDANVVAAIDAVVIEAAPVVEADAPQVVELFHDGIASAQLDVDLDLVSAETADDAAPIALDVDPIVFAAEEHEAHTLVDHVAAMSVVLPLDDEVAEAPFVLEVSQAAEADAVAEADAIDAIADEIAAESVAFDTTITTPDALVVADVSIGEDDAMVPVGVFRLFDEIEPIVLRRDDEPGPPQTDSAFDAQPGDDASSFAAAALLSRELGGDAEPDWRTGLLGASTDTDATAVTGGGFFTGHTAAAVPGPETESVSEPEPMAEAAAEVDTASVPVISGLETDDSHAAGAVSVSTEDGSDVRLPDAVPVVCASDVEVTTTALDDTPAPVEETAPVSEPGQVEDLDSPPPSDSQPVSEPPADTGPVEAPARVERPAMMPDHVPEVVIVDDPAHGNAWDDLPSEHPVVVPDAAPATEPCVAGDVPVLASDEGNRAPSEPALLTSASSTKKKRRRSRNKKGIAAIDVPSPGAVHDVPPVAAPQPDAVSAPEPVVLPAAISSAPSAAAAAAAPSDDGAGPELAARQASLLGREVPAWTPPSDLESLDLDVETSVSPMAWTPPKLRAETLAGEPDASAVLAAVTGRDIGVPAVAPAPVVTEAHAPMAPSVAPAPSSLGAPEALRTFELEVRAVGMPDLDEHETRSGRSNVLAMGEALGPLTGSAGRSATQPEPWPTAPAVQPAAPRGINWRRFIAASVLIALFQGVAFAAWWWVQPGARGTLVVQTTKSGVEVLLDDKVVGRTPFREDVAPGRHTLRLRHGSNVRDMPVEISVGVVTTQALEWPSSVGGKGNLQVTSNPTGASVLVNGKVRGTAPLLLENLPAGDQMLTLRGDAGSVTVKAMVVADETTPLEVKIFAGWILVDAPVEVNLLLDGRDKIGSSMDGQILLPPGTHRVRAVNEALGIRQWLTVNVEPGAVERVTFAVPPGTLTLQDEAEVFLDGASVGTTPGSIAIPPGTHEIVLRLADGTERRQAMTVRAGQRVEF